MYIWTQIYKQDKHKYISGNTTVYQEYSLKYKSEDDAKYWISSGPFVNIDGR